MKFIVHKNLLPGFIQICGLSVWPETMPPFVIQHRMSAYDIKRLVKLLKDAVRHMNKQSKKLSSQKPAVHAAAKALVNTDYIMSSPGDVNAPSFHVIINGFSASVLFGHNPIKAYFNLRQLEEFANALGSAK